MHRWPQSIGLWKWREHGEELWFVGKRFWPDREVYFDAFRLAMAGTGTVEARDQFWDDKYNCMPVGLEVRKLGRECLLALVSR